MIDKKNCFNKKTVKITLKIDAIKTSLKLFIILTPYKLIGFFKFTNINSHIKPYIKIIGTNI